MNPVLQATTLFPSNFESLPGVFNHCFNFSNGTVHVMKLPGRKVACVLWDQHSLHYGGAEIVANIMKSSLRYVLLFVFCSIYKHIGRCVSILGIHADLIKRFDFVPSFHDVVVPKGKSERWSCKMQLCCLQKDWIRYFEIAKNEVFLSYENSCELRCLIQFLSEIPETTFITV